MKPSRVLTSFLLALTATVASARAPLAPSARTQNAVPGARPSLVPPSGNSSLLPTALAPVVTETGLISLSVDGLGTSAAGGTIHVDKPTGATVRGAYFAAASTGFQNYAIPNGDITLAGTPISWATIVDSTISSKSHWSDVTSIVAPIVNAAPAGVIDLTVTETLSSSIDGSILAVIFDDPNQTTVNTVVLLFGAQNIAGDTFNVAFGSPLDLTDPNLGIALSLGISFGYQSEFSVDQVNFVDVNGVRMTSSAGGPDDSQTSPVNGSLLTVGGIGDDIANPPPFAPPSGPNAQRTDDELYNLLPFVSHGDTTLTVFTLNPSNDDNIFFGALSVTSAVAIVGEDILLGPVSAVRPVGDTHTVFATLQDDNGSPIVGRLVTFEVTAGPHAGLTGIATSDLTGNASFSFVGATWGTDTLVARFTDSQGATETSNSVSVSWFSALLLCPPDVSQVWNGGIPAGQADPSNTGIAAFSTNCPSAGPVLTFNDISIVQNTPQNPHAPEAIITRRWRLTDSCGTDLSCDQTITFLSPSGLTGAMTLDIMPGNCPNTLAVTGSAANLGFTNIALAGTWLHSVINNVDRNSLVLERADGIGLSVPVGRFALFFQDVTRPYYGPVGGCNSAGGEFYADAVVRVPNRLLVQGLGLNALPSGTQAQIRLRGRLLDGTQIYVTDFIRAQ